MAALVSTALAASVGVADAAQDPYSADVTTRTTVRTPDPVQTHTRVTITVRVTANSPSEPTGTVTLELSPSPAGAGQERSAAASPRNWSRTVDYDGGTQEVTGPKFPKPGEWLLTAEFTADDPRFRGSRDEWRFSVVDRPKHNDQASAGDSDQSDQSDDSDGTDVRGDGDDASGLLPDAGGPALLWLLLGLALVVSGIGAVLVARRRSTAPATPA